MKSIERCVLCRSRRELSNEALITKFGVDTAENEPSEAWPDCSLPRTAPLLGRRNSHVYCLWFSAKRTTSEARSQKFMHVCRHTVLL